MTSKGEEVVALNIAHVIGDFFDTGDLEILAHFDRSDELGGLEQGLVGARVEPGIPTPQPLDCQQPVLEINIVKIGDFELAACRGFEAGCDPDNRVIVEIKPGYGPMRVRQPRLLLDRDRLTVGVEIDSAIEDVVAEHEGYMVTRDEVPPDQEGLREPLRPWLRGISDRQAPLAAVSEQRFEPREIRGRRDDEDLANAGEHQGR